VYSEKTHTFYYNPPSVHSFHSIFH
jgi:hypothetical protein